MTRVDVSPEQLNAEAAAPASADLVGRLALHRALAHAETSIVRLHQRDGDDAGLGPPFSHPFVQFLDESFGVSFPWSAGLKTLRLECRRSHSEHWRDEYGGSLCYRLVSMTCRFGWSYQRACYDLQVTPERTERTLQRALKRIEDKLAELQARATETVHADAGRNDWMAPAHQHRAVAGLHAVECPQCLRRAAA